MQVVRRGWLYLNRSLQTRPWLLLFGVALLYGFGHTDFRDFQSLTQNPFVTLADPGRQFLHSSPLIVFLGWPVTHLAGPNVSYLIVSLAGFVALAAAVVAFLRSLPAGQAENASLVLLSSPMLLVLLHWIGKSDTFLIALYLATLLVRHRTWPTIVLWALIIAAHREIGTVVLVGDLILRWKSPIAVVCGGLIGHGLVSTYLSLLTPKPADRIDFALALVRNVRTWQQNPVTHIVLGPGWLWTILARLAVDADGWRFAAVLALTFAASANTADFTRDFIMCCTPLIAFASERFARSKAGNSGIAWPALFLVQAQVAAGNQVLDSSWTR